MTNRHLAGRCDDKLRAKGVTGPSAQLQINPVALQAAFVNSGNRRSQTSFRLFACQALRGAMGCKGTSSGGNVAQKPDSFHASLVSFGGTRVTGSLATMPTRRLAFSRTAKGSPLMLTKKKPSYEEIHPGECHL